MSIIIPKREIWTRQPQVQVRIDWSNPITKNLRSAVIPTKNTDSATNIQLGVLGTRPATVVTQAGLGILPNGGGLSLPGSECIRLSAPPVTVVAIVTRIGSLPQYGRLADAAYNASNTDGGWDIEGASGGAAFNFVTWSSATPNSLAGPSLTLNKPSVLVCINDGTYSSIYLDGVLAAGPTAKAFSATTRTDPFGIGVTRVGTSSCNGTLIIHSLTVLGRVLGAGEVQMITANPYQVFSP